MLKTKLGNLALNGAFTNASGINDDSVEKLLEIANSSAGFITTKTATFLPRAGNPGPRFYILNNITINSVGIANVGYKNMAKKIQEVKKQTNKPIFASMSGFTPEESQEIAKTLSKVADVLEVNLSCPNILGKGQIIYDFEMSTRILDAVKKNTDKKVAVKVAAFLDPTAQEKFCEIIKKTGIDIIVAINTLGNAMYIDSDRKKIMLKPKWGGLGGEPIKMIGLGNVRRYYEYLKGSIPIIGCGGIANGKDAFTYALAGASAFATGSCLAKEGTGLFARLESELQAELKKHNYSCLGEAVGKAEEI